MKLLRFFTFLAVGATVGALILPVIMSALFHAFAGAGGDPVHLLRRFQSPQGTPESWAKGLYVILGFVQGALSGYFGFCWLRRDYWGWTFFCRQIAILSLCPLGPLWFHSLTDGYNTPVEALVLNGIPTLWSLLLLYGGFLGLKSCPKTPLKVRAVQWPTNSSDIGPPKSDEELQTMLGEMTRATRLRWMTLFGVYIELMLLLYFLVSLTDSRRNLAAMGFAVVLIVLASAAFYALVRFVKKMPMNCTFVSFNADTFPCKIESRAYRFDLTPESCSWSQGTPGQTETTRVFYRDIRRVEVLKSGIVFYLKLDGVESAKDAPIINLLPVKPGDCTTFLNAIVRHAPQAQVNDFAAAFSRGIYPPLTR